MKRRGLSAAILLVAGIIAPGLLMGQVKAPPAEELAKADADIIGTDDAAKLAAIDKIKGWVKGGFVSDHVWRNWIPQLVKDDRQQEIADITMDGLLHRPDPAAIVPLMQFRSQALLALKKNDEALIAAKSYFNVIEMKNSSRGIDAITTALVRTHPEDAEIVRKFRAEQAAASQGGGTAVPDDGVMRGIKVETKPYETQLVAYRSKTAFRDRVAYGDLLLVSDQCSEAEKVFREVYQTADAGDQLNQATEGIAKAMRGEDGNPARAAVWFKSAQAQAATQAATTVASRATNSSAPASKPATGSGLP